MSIVVSVIIFLGLFFLSFLLNYPHKKLFSTKPNPKYIPYLHLLGWGLLVFSLSLSISVYGVGMGITYWFGYLSMMALVLVVGYAKI